MNHFYITTPIYYVNDVPHLGHAYTTIAADALARFHRMRGVDTRLLTGTDEHGQKVEATATARGLTPRQLVDEVAPRFEQCWRALDISNDDFIRTTEDRHKAVVAEVWKRMAARDDIYLASYDGWYCVGCEAFYTESQLVDDGGTKVCPVHKRAVEWVAKEASYFFRMSKYQDALLEHIERHPHFIQPDNYRNEVVAFVKSGLRDLSVSRTSFKWGIPVPGDDQHVIYVWLDALTNYMSALGPIDGELYQRHWPASVHLIGKDILRFHAVYWPCFLMSAGLPLPKQIFTHGWWSVRGEKISKSLPATRVDPVAIAHDLGEKSAVPAVGVDALRYFLLREVPLGLDGDFTYEALIGRFNADLANDLGNLITRSLTMFGKFAEASPPTRDAALAGTGVHATLETAAETAAADGAAHLAVCAPSKALEAIWRLVAEANSYIGATAPWTIAKDPARAGELGHVLHSLAAALWWIRRLIAPVMPATAGQLDAALGVAAGTAVTWPEPGQFGLDLPALRFAAPLNLFPKIDAKRKDELLERWIPAEVRAEAEAATAAAATASAAAAGSASITYDDFAKVELRVGRVKSAEKIAKADKLLHLKVDLGEGRDRSIVAGIAVRFSPEELVGRQVLVVANLAPRNMRGIPSEGMILAAGDDTILGLAGVDGDVPPGTRVR